MAASNTGWTSPRSASWRGGSLAKIPCGSSPIAENGGGAGGPTTGWVLHEDVGLGQDPHAVVVPERPVRAVREHHADRGELAELGVDGIGIGEERRIVRVERRGRPGRGHASGLSLAGGLVNRSTIQSTTAGSRSRWSRLADDVVKSWNGPAVPGGGTGANGSPSRSSALTVGDRAAQRDGRRRRAAADVGEHRRDQPGVDVLAAGRGVPADVVGELQRRERRARHRRRCTSPAAIVVGAPAAASARSVADANGEPVQSRTVAPGCHGRDAVTAAAGHREAAGRSPGTRRWPPARRGSARAAGSWRPCCPAPTTAGTAGSPASRATPANIASRGSIEPRFWMNHWSAGDVYDPRPCGVSTLRYVATPCRRPARSIVHSA